MAHDRQAPDALERRTTKLLEPAQKFSDPDSTSELHDRVVAILKAIGADVALFYSLTEGNESRLRQWLAVCEPRTLRLAALGKFVTRNQNRPVYRCPRCEDTALIRGACYNESAFCTCHAGQQAEGGWWKTLVFGQPWDKKRSPRATAIEAMKQYCARYKRDYETLKKRIQELERNRPQAEEGWD